MATENPRFSIITALYKSTLYMEGLVASVQAQTVTDWELILVDDCSPDGTFAMAQGYAADDSRIIALKTEKNSGAPATARNVGIKAARGEFVTFLDHDDVIPQHKLIRCHEVMIDQGLDFVCTNAELLNAATGKVDMLALGEVQGSVEEIAKNFASRLLEGNFVPPNSTLIRRAVFEKVGYFDETLKGADDFDMWYRIAREFRCGYLPAVLASWRYKNVASISADDTKMIEDERRVYTKFLADSPRAVAGVARATIQLANRHLLKSKYQEAAAAYKEAGAKKFWFMTMFAGPIFRRLYMLKRRLGAKHEFSPITLDFRTKP